MGGAAGGSDPPAELAGLCGGRKGAGAQGTVQRRARLVDSRGDPPVQRLLCAVPLWAQGDPGRFIGSRHTEEEVEGPGAGVSRRLPLALTLGCGDASRRRRAEQAERVAAAAAVALGTGSAGGDRGDRTRAGLDGRSRAQPLDLAARVAASVAPIQAFGRAALAVFSGPQHGGACDRIEALLSEIGPCPAPPPRSMSGWRGEATACGRPSAVPDGDPRTPPFWRWPPR